MFTGALAVSYYGRARTTVPRERALKDVENVKAILKFTKVDLERVKRQTERDSTLQILEGIMAREG